MKPYRNALLLSLLIGLASCAGQTYQAQVGPSFLRVTGNISLADSVGNLPATNNMEDDLGVGGTEVAPYIQGRSDFEEHRFRANAFFSSSDGEGTLASNYGNIAAGQPVSTSMDLFAIATNYSYAILREEGYRVGVGGQLGFYSLDVSARSAGGREEVTTEVLAPAPYAEAELYFDDLTLGTSIAVLAADLGDGDGRFLDIELYGQMRLNEKVDLRAGYRHVVLDVDGVASSREFDADVDVAGFYLTAGIRF
jgi:hypothetical protein